MDTEQAMAEIRAVLAGLDALSAADAGSGTTVTLATDQSIDITPRIESGHPKANRPEPPRAGVGVVIAERVPKTMRKQLDDAGWSWIDRRGHINLRHGTVLIDADIPPIPKTPHGLQSVDPFAGKAALAVALVALERHPEPLEGIRATARTIGTAPTTVSNAITRLVAAGLLGRDHQAIVPELFWALTDQWHLATVGLASAPDGPVDGTVLIGSHAAAALGAPAVTTTDYPLELLAADDATARRIVRNCGTSPIEKAPAHLSIAPNAYAATPTTESIRGIPIAHPVVVALALATDPARGAEIVTNWEHPDRVW